MINLDRSKMMFLTKDQVFILAGIVVIVISAIFHLSLGLTIVQDYNGESFFKKTNCTVRAIEFNNDNPKNEWTRCPWTCTVSHTPDGLKTFCEISEFPCLKIVVDVATKFGLKSAIIHENPDKMQKHYECSTYYCDRDSVVNEKLVNKFKRKWGNVGSSYPCFYKMDTLNMDDDYDNEIQEHALIYLTHTEASYVNSIFWPTLMSLVGVVLLCMGVYYRIEKRMANRDYIVAEKNEI
jgi:hypothetical protein